MTPSATITTDLLTPLGAYLRLRGLGAASFLLESVERGRLGRSSWMGAGSRLVSFAEAEALGLPVVGYLAYDHVAELEPTVALPEEGHGLPESRLVVAETLVRFDHGAGTADVLAGDPEEIEGRLEAGIPSHQETRGTTGPLRRFPERERYEEMVRIVKRHIVAGDVFQCVPSQRAERPTSASPLDVYRALRRVNPSPYLFLLELDGVSLVGSSPERLVACEGGRASLCPIAGTTEPTEGDVERLLSSEKDRAEHVMLVDLGRNDLSRVCRPGTVHVARSRSKCETPSLSSPVTSETRCVTCENRSGSRKRSTRTLPARQTRERSFRPRSTSITCSARSFSEASSRSASPSPGCVVPAIGFRLARPPSHLTSVSGEEPTSASPSSSSRKRYGDGLTLRSAR